MDIWTVLKIIGIFMLICAPLGVLKHYKQEYGIPMFLNGGFLLAFAGAITTYVAIFITDDSPDVWADGSVWSWLLPIGAGALSALSNKQKGLGWISAMVLALAQYCSAVLVGAFVLVAALVFRSGID